MEKTNTKKCPGCQSLDIFACKTEKPSNITKTGGQGQSEPTNIFYHCQCNKCKRQFEYWPTKKLGE